MLAQLEKAYPKDVRLVYRQFPLVTIHDKAALAAQATESAGLQGKFWEMHELLFVRQQEWTGLTPEQFQEWLITQAGSLGLDVKKFTSDLTSQAMVDISQKAWNTNSSIGIPSTPFLVINGVQYNGPQDLANMSAMVDAILLEKRQFSDCPSVSLDPGKKYLAILHTEKGDITIELYADKAPLAVSSFLVSDAALLRSRRMKAW